MANGEFNSAAPAEVAPRVNSHNLGVLLSAAIARDRCTTRESPKSLISELEVSTSAVGCHRYTMPSDCPAVSNNLR